MIEIKSYYSGSSGNLYSIHDQDNTLMIEAGIPIKKLKAAFRYSMSNIIGCLVSHSHGDHAKSANDLMQSGIDCFMSHETAKAIGAEGHRVHIVHPMQQFQIEQWAIKPFDLVHDVPNLGFIISNGKEKILYLTDTNYCPYRFQGLTHIMIECNYCSDILKDNVAEGLLDIVRAKRTFHSHMSLQTCKEFFRVNDMSKVQEIHLLHLSDDNSNEEQFKRDIESITGRPVYVA